MPEILRVSSMCDMKGGQLISYMSLSKEIERGNLSASMHYPTDRSGLSKSRVVMDQYLCF
jgi:hypothetical protein